LKHQKQLNLKNKALLSQESQTHFQIVLMPFTNTTTSAMLKMATGFT
jgi:hypothetical protein